MELIEPFIRSSDTLVEFEVTFNDTGVDQHTIFSLEVQRDELKDIWLDVKQSYSKCLQGLSAPANVDSSNVTVVKAKYNNAYKAYVRCMSKMSELTTDFRSQSMAAQPVDEFSSNIRLPPCDTEVFKGDYENWPSFRDIFSAVYIRNSRLSKVEKLFHLLKKTSGEALEIVKKSPLTNSGFEQAWRNLQERYENKRILINNQYKVLFNLTHVKEESGEKIKDLQRSINNCISSLRQQSVDISKWDSMLVYLCSSRLPEVSLSIWEQSVANKTETSTWEEMNTFLTQRFKSLEAVSDLRGTLQSSSKATGSNSKSNKNQQAFHTNVSSTPGQCKLCSETHSIRICPKFLQLNVIERFATAKRLKLCLNCLAFSHIIKDCKSNQTCRKCKQKHHTLLHREETTAPSNSNSLSLSSPHQAPSASYANISSPQAGPPLANSTQIQSTFNNASTSFQRSPQSSNDSPQFQATCQNNRIVEIQSSFHLRPKHVLLGTAMVEIIHGGIPYSFRALIDPGSEVTLITERLQKLLRLPTKSIQAQISGLNGAISAHSSKLCNFVLKSPIDSKVEIDVHAMVVPVLSSNLPSFSFDISREQLGNLCLADPNFNKSSHIDMLIGGDLYPLILLSGVKSKIMGSLLAQETVFGWIITGPLSSSATSTSKSFVSYFTEISLEQQIGKFWEIEQIPRRQSLNDADKWCEEFYSKTTYRNHAGRYVVHLPFKDSCHSGIQLGKSRNRAANQFIRNELRLCRQMELKTDYDKVLEEYLSLGHMTAVNAPVETDTPVHYYLPHHAVIKEESISTRLRVVFNASYPTSNGLSLNDNLHIGPSLQTDLVFLLINWRFFKFVFNADITKMYRQILVDPKHTPFQRILFRNSPSKQLQDFELNTVTFGVNCAPYLAIRTLLQLASDIEDSLPLAANVLRKYMYVDDVLAGGHDLNTALQARNQLLAALESAGFQLRKWTSNSSALLTHISKDDLLNEQFLILEEVSTSKALGIRWNAVRDFFYFAVNATSIKDSYTKREVLSCIAKLFDPAGWLSPVVIIAKILMQKVWLSTIDWDDILPDSLNTQFQEFLRNLPDIQSIQIPRWIGFSPSQNVQFHAFCDASEKAYAACVYLRAQVGSNEFQTHLLYSKTKVAPIKSVSLPRLELCGALLLSEMIEALKRQIHVNLSTIYCWTDSTIVLAWLHKPPCTWTSFVANRVSKIIDRTEMSSWRHISSGDNPADLASRGCAPQLLQQNPLWWCGPSWLRLEEMHWYYLPSVEDSCTELERRTVKSNFSTFDKNEDILERFSCLSRAWRVLSYCFRFFFRTYPKQRLPKRYDSAQVDATEIKNLIATRYDSVRLDATEIKFVKQRLMRLTQRAFYPTEIECLLQQHHLPPKSNLLSLNPYLDPSSILRANGRLASSKSLNFAETHPIILPYGCHLTKLLIEFIHKISLHGGNALVLRLVRSEFWIPKVRNLIKATIHRCRICVIERKQQRTQVMAALPAERSSFSRPFTYTGVDFSGPFEIKSYHGRGFRISKGYVCIFICFCTKAIHLEATSDLSSDTFLAAFARFSSRRGCPAQVYSDNGTNFVGAAKILKSDYDHFLHSSQDVVLRKYAHQNLTWNFIPAGAPHMGGLWEAGVKSFKLHLRKTAGLLKYSFEEFQTLLTKIESCLNSRPLSPQSADPMDLAALTPGHFLIGGPLLNPAESIPNKDPQSLINRWQRVKAMNHYLCERWKYEYLTELHKRNKWKLPHEDVKLNDLVVVRQDNLASNEWRLGRIIKAYQGSDARVRVADVRTANGIITRPITKLIVLPSS